MTQQIINTGTGPDSYTGETLRTAFTKINANFSELYGNVEPTSDLVVNIIEANVATLGVIYANTITANGNVTAHSFSGNGALLTNVTAVTSTYVTGLTSANVTTALGYTPVNSNSSSYSNVTISGNLVITNGHAPASHTASGTTGQIAWANGYIYVCVATNTWQRAALSSW